MVLEMSEVVRNMEDYNHFSYWVVLLVTLSIRNALKAV